MSQRARTPETLAAVATATLGTALAAAAVRRLGGPAAATGVVAGLSAAGGAASLLAVRSARASQRSVQHAQRTLEQATQQALAQQSRQSQQAAATTDRRLAALDTQVRATQRIAASVPDTVRRDLDTHFRQLEALTTLYALVPPRAAVPASRGWACSPDLLAHLVGTVLDERPAVVVELGSGLSTLWLAYALERVGAGRVVSLEHDADYAEQTRALLARHGLEQWVEVRHAPLSVVTLGDTEWKWYDPAALAGCEGWSLLLVDGPPGSVGPLSRYPALPLLWELRSRTDEVVVVLDDGDRSDEQEVLTRWEREFDLTEVRTLPHEKGTATLRARPA